MLGRCLAPTHHSIGLGARSKGARNDQQAVSGRKLRGGLTDKASKPPVLQDAAQFIERPCLQPVCLGLSITKAVWEVNADELRRRANSLLI